MITRVEDFTQRVKKPGAGNKYYNRRDTGGYSPCIFGSPVDASCNVLSNCVGYAAGRFNEILEMAGEGTGWQYLGSCNAEDFVAMARSQKLEVSQTPALGAVAVWAKGKAGNSSDGAGHVAVVEKVTYSAGGSIKSITTSESGYGCKNPFWLTERTYGNGTWGGGTGYTFLGFVLNPAVQIDGKHGDVDGTETGTSIPNVTVRKGDTGSAVKWVQEQLMLLGYLRRGEDDGDFGRITLGGVLAFQLESGLEVDGVVGIKTKQALLRATGLMDAMNE